MSSRAAGGCVLSVLTLGAAAAVFAVSPAVGVLTVWGAGVVALVRSVRRTANPAPPPIPERGCEAKPQFTVVEDRPGHCAIHWQEEVNER